MDDSTAAPAAIAPPPLAWVEVDVDALRHNAGVLIAESRAAGRRPLTCAMVKGNAYGHGRVLAANAFLGAGVDWLGVADIAEAYALRAAGVVAPLYNVVLTPPEQVAAAVAADVRMVTADADAIAAAGAAARAQGRIARLHLKLETGTNRQGVRHDEALALCDRALAEAGVVVEGVASHYANIEDTTDHSFAREQRRRFDDGVAAIRARVAAANPDAAAVLAHSSNSAALLLWPEYQADLVRFGIASFGLWPSKETFLSAQQLGRHPIELRPALTWKTRVAQVKDVPAGEFVGYGCAFRTLRPTRLGILPVGYFDGYDRQLSSRAQVLVGGHRAPVAGRVAMNLIAVDLTDAPGAARGDEVVLLGAQGQQRVTADELAALAGTIHYEITTRIAERLPRIAVGL